MTDEEKYEARKAESRASAKPGEWCHECDDWSVNCMGDCSDEAIAEDQREREDEALFLAGSKDGYDHDRGVCEGPGCCRWCDVLPGREPRKLAWKPTGAS